MARTTSYPISSWRNRPTSPHCLSAVSHRRMHGTRHPVLPQRNTLSGQTHSWVMPARSASARLTCWKSSKAWDR